MDANVNVAINFEDLFEFSPEPLDAEQDDREGEPVSPAPCLQTPAVDASSSWSSASPSVSPSHSASASAATAIPLSTSLPARLRSTTTLSLSYTGSSSPGGSSVGFGGHYDSSGGLDSPEGSLLPLLDELSSISAIASSAPVTSSKGRRGRKPGQKSHKSDVHVRLERSRQSARECRARKKLRYQYLDDMILERERANIKLREELLRYQDWCHDMDKGKLSDEIKDYLRRMKSCHDSTAHL